LNAVLASQSNAYLLTRAEVLLLTVRNDSARSAKETYFHLPIFNRLEAGIA
jgi:hypothetical protein